MQLIRWFSCRLPNARETVGFWAAQREIELSPTILWIQLLPSILPLIRSNNSLEKFYPNHAKLHCSMWLQWKKHFFYFKCKYLQRPSLFETRSGLFDEILVRSNIFVYHMNQKEMFCPFTFCVNKQSWFDCSGWPLSGPLWIIPSSLFSFNYLWRGGLNLHFDLHRCYLSSATRVYRFVIIDYILWSP